MISDLLLAAQEQDGANVRITGSRVWRTLRSKRYEGFVPAFVLYEGNDFCVYERNGIDLVTNDLMPNDRLAAFSRGASCQVCQGCLIANRDVRV